MEYLFLGEHPALPGDMDGVVESGIMPTSASTAMVRATHLPLLSFHPALDCRERGQSDSSTRSVPAPRGRRVRWVREAWSSSGSGRLAWCAQGLDSAVVLSNSVLLADQLRLQAVLEARHHPAAKQGGGATAVDKVRAPLLHLRPSRRLRSGCQAQEHRCRAGRRALSTRCSPGAMPRCCRVLS